jgi:hypothetical protein
MNSVEDCLCRTGIIVFVLSIVEYDRLLCGIHALSKRQIICRLCLHDITKMKTACIFRKYNIFCMMIKIQCLRN